MILDASSEGGLAAGDWIGAGNLDVVCRVMTVSER